MKLLSAITLIFMFLSDSHASDFRGIKIGSKIKYAEEAARIIAKTEIIPIDSGFFFATHIKDFPVRVFVVAEDGVVGSIEFRFSRKHYSIIRDAMFDKYGSDFKIAGETFANGFGAKFTYEKASKISRSEIITIDEKSRFDDLESHAYIMSRKFLDNRTKEHQNRPGF